MQTFLNHSGELGLELIHRRSSFKRIGLSKEAEKTAKALWTIKCSATERARYIAVVDRSAQVSIYFISDEVFNEVYRGGRTLRESLLHREGFAILRREVIKDHYGKLAVFLEKRIRYFWVDTMGIALKELSLRA